MKTLSLAFVLAAAFPAAALANPTPTPSLPENPHPWSLTLGGGALAPLGAMRDGYRDGLLAGARLAVRSHIGAGIALGVDYSPLPSRSATTSSSSNTYGTVALIPEWSLGNGPVRVGVGAGGGLALARIAQATTTAAAAMAQFQLELRVAASGGLVILGGGTHTFGATPYQYAWGMGGLALEF